MTITLEEAHELYMLGALHIDDGLIVRRYLDIEGHCVIVRLIGHERIVQCLAKLDLEGKKMARGKIEDAIKTIYIKGRLP